MFTIGNKCPLNGRLKLDRWLERYPMCWICGIRTAHHAGHGILNKGLVRNRKKHKLLDREENLCPQCETCNLTIADSWENRNKMYNLKCDEMGEDVVNAWIDEVGLKISERFRRE